MRFYESTLGGKLELMPQGSSPIADQTPPEKADLILHARLALDGGGVLLASDWTASTPFEGVGGFAVSVILPTVAGAQRAFDALAVGGNVTMPFGKTFWAGLRHARRPVRNPVDGEREWLTNH